MHSCTRRPCIPARSAVSPDEVKALFAQFMSLKKAGDETSATDLLISASEFQAALGFKGKDTSAFLGRIFRQFDENKDELISFEEFMHSIAVLTPTAAPEAKLKCAYLR